MTEWRKVKLGDCCTKIGSGATPKGGATVYIDSGTSFIRSQNVYNLAFDYNGLTHITEEAAQRLAGVTVREEDVLLNITGDSVARTCIVPPQVLPARVNQHVSILRTNKEIINSRYLNYYLASPHMQAYMLGLAVGKGASRNAMTKNLIENFEVPCPPLEIQDRVVTVLSRYDALIENYQRQIKLLEEAAQRLYKEWFVDLHFPGHQSTPIINNLPEGWEKRKIGDFARIKSGFAFKSKDWQTLGCPVVKIKDITGTFVSTNDLDCVPIEVARNASSFVLNKGDLVIAMTGATIGKIGLLTENGIYTNQRVGKFFMNDKYLLPFSYCFFKQETTTKMILQISSSSSAQPNISGGQLESFEFACNSKLINDFNLIMYPCFSQMIHLKSQINLLAEARDRLLPKLMSAEIEV